MARVKLTKTLVDDLQPPEKGQAFVWDSELAGFAVRITATGVKAWIIQMRVRGGKERRMTVGLCNKVPLDKARREARERNVSTILRQFPGPFNRVRKKALPLTLVP